MKQNFIFRSFKGLGKHLLFALVTQVSGLLIFILSVGLQLKLQIKQEYVIINSLIIVSVCLFLYAFAYFRFEFRLLRIKSWPAETKEEVLVFFQNLIANANKTYAEVKAMLRDLDDMFFENVQLRKFAQSRRDSSNILKDIAESQTRIINLRVKLKVSKQKGETVIAYFNKARDSVERANTLDDASGNLEEYINTINLEFAKLKNMKGEEQEILLQQTQASKELSK